ncbi:MAG TPA: TadE family protein [Bacillota bacterium]|nr:TadE family protein [Bacillota bacterium]
MLIAILKKLKQERGQAMVEMALIAPILMLLLFGTIEFGRIFNSYLEVTNAAREGARAGVVGATDSSIVTAVKNSAVLLDGDFLTINVNPGADYRNRGTALNVTVYYPVEIYTPIIRNITGNPFIVRGSATMRME